VPNVTAHPSTSSVPITALLYKGPIALFMCGFNVPYAYQRVNSHQEIVPWFGINGTILSWFTLYLSSRFVKCNIHNLLQGSVLGLLLFIMHTTPQYHCFISFFKSPLCVDDTSSSQKWRFKEIFFFLSDLTITC